MLKKRDEEYEIFEEKFQYILDRYNELNPDKHINYLGNKKIFTIKEHYTKEQKIWFQEQIAYKKADVKYKKIDEECDLFIKEKHVKFFDNQMIMMNYTYLVFFIFIKIFNKNKYLRFHYFLNNNRNSLLKHHQITIISECMSYVNPIDYILEKWEK